MIAPVSIATPRYQLRVEFTWAVDRFSHLVIDQSGRRMSSIEGDTDQAWPPSPPIQQLSLEVIEGKPVILGVGGAGKGHWSISVTCVERDGIDAIRFELACRCRGTIGQLASTYQQGSTALNIHPRQGTLCRALELNEYSLFPAAAAEGPTQQWSYEITE